MATANDKIDSPFVVDENDLWGEWTRLAGRGYAAAVRAADARHAWAQAKARLDVERARLFHGIRKNPGHYDLPDGKPPSNEVTASVVEIQPSHEKAVHAVNDAKRLVDLADAEVEVFVTLRKTLENLVELTAMGFHAEREPRPLSPGSRDRLDRRKRDAGGGVDVE